MSTSAIHKESFTLPVEEFGSLIGAIRGAGFRPFGPKIGDGAITLGELSESSNHPPGWTDEQSPGSYRLQRTGSPALFDYVLGPHSWKQFLHPPIVSLWRRNGSTGEIESVTHATGNRQPLALIGVRPCELAAIAVQDRVLIGDSETDPVYHASRADAFVLVINCARPGGTCFCASMGTGPKAQGGFDLAVTEVCHTDEHCVVVEVGSERGAKVLSSTVARSSTAEERAAANEVSITAARRMGRSLELPGLAELLQTASDSTCWNEVAKRCLGCANCTMVCPTCFCTNVEDSTDLTGSEAVRSRVWDSCFTLGFSYIHGGTIRSSASARYRQWLTHKLSTWHNQFGTSGCVGCGRCITWCPVGIDITEEARAIRSQVPAAPRPMEV